MLALLLFVGYVIAFVRDLRGWFHPGWTTDDALQQTFLFYDALDPTIFRGDLIAEVMRGYLAPLHYWLGYGITLLTQNPVMTGHWIMLLQLVLALTFFFLFIRRFSSSTVGLLACTWLLHTRASIQRLTGGLPRGWAPVVLVVSLYFISTRNHKAVLLALLLGCLLHPPATFLAAATYGLWLCIGVMQKESRKEYLRPLLTLLALAPLYLFVVFAVVWRPEDIGQMVTLQEASSMPEFQRPDGRFPFLPLLTPVEDMKTFGFEPFVSHLSGGLRQVRAHAREGVLVLFVLMLVGAGMRRKSPMPRELLVFLVATAIVYLLSREFAFQLYVPNRHIQIPFTVFWISAFSIGLWRLCHSREPDSEHRAGIHWCAPLCVLGMGIFILCSSGDGLTGDANINASSTRRGGVFLWLRENTPTHALIAGYPTFVDDVMLFGERRAYATTETYHPFYKGYVRQIEPRIRRSLRINYARGLQQLYDLSSEVGIDYVVFDRKLFYPKALDEVRYFEPFTDFVQELASYLPESYAYKQLPREIDPVRAPYLVYRDNRAAVVDIHQLGAYLAQQNSLEQHNTEDVG